MVVHGVVEPALGAEHVLRLKQLPNGIVDRIVTAILALNGMTAEAQQAAADTFPEPESDNHG
jgi:hypothetical protein